jgi:hypothetical protein
LEYNFTHLVRHVRTYCDDTFAIAARLSQFSFIVRQALSPSSSGLAFSANCKSNSGECVPSLCDILCLRLEMAFDNSAIQDICSERPCTDFVSAILLNRRSRATKSATFIALNRFENYSSGAVLLLVSFRS